LSNPLHPSPAHQRLIRKLETIADLTAGEKQAVSLLPLEIRSLAADSDIVSEGEVPSHCCLIIEGFACRYKVLNEGQRQIMSFHCAGDIPDLQSLHLPTMDHSLGTLTPVTAGFIPHGAIRELTRREPGVTAALWRDTLIDAAVFREWLVGVGRRSAHERIAHLLCEVYVKMRAVGLAEEHRMDLPLTQVELGDALGLSSVHVNRVLQDLRAANLISGRGRQTVIEDWPGLQHAGDFDATYLHLRKLAA
jgi:CRP-like cAMP-binding protein